MVSTDTPQVLSGWLRCCPIAGKPGSWSSSAPSADGLGAPSAQLGRVIEAPVLGHPYPLDSPRARSRSSHRPTPCGSCVDCTPWIHTLWAVDQSGTGSTKARASLRR